MTPTQFLRAAVPLALALAFAFSTAAMAQTATTAPAAKKPAAAAPKPDAAKPAAPKPAVASPAAGASLLGQYGDWGAYSASPGGKKVCFALAKPATALTEPAGRNRDPAYMFISTRPSEKVKEEVSVIVGYPQKPNVDASAAVGAANYVMYTQNDGAWIKNAAEEARMVDALRKGADVVIKSESARGTKTTDTYSLKGLDQALARVAQECK
jgi:hypothetical protein